MATPRKKPEDLLKAGRPSDYNETIADIICQKVATHTIGLPRLCAMYDELPAECTINIWRSKHPEFAVKYAQAKMKQADLLAEECLEIADDSARDKKIDKDGNESIDSEFVARSRLRIDTRKWLASKLLPKAYGDKTVIETKNDDETEDLKKELKAVRGILAEKNKGEY